MELKGIFNNAREMKEALRPIWVAKDPIPPLMIEKIAERLKILAEQIK